jgi:cell division protein FtsB
MIVLWILLTTASGVLCSEPQDKRLLLNDQTLVQQTIQQLQTEVQQLKAEVNQLKQGQPGLSIFNE